MRGCCETGVREDNIVDVDPTCSPGLRDSFRHTPAATALVDVAPCKRLQLADPHPGVIKDNGWKRVSVGQQATYRRDVLRNRRLQLLAFLVRQLDDVAVASWVALALPPSVIE